MQFKVIEPIMATVDKLRGNLESDLSGDYSTPFLTMYNYLSHHQVITLCDALELKNQGTFTVRINQRKHTCYVTETNGQTLLIRQYDDYEYDV